MTTLMQQEASSTPEIINQQLTENISIIKSLVEHLKKNPPPFAYTIARGSSDNAAYYAQYLFATQTGLVTASLPPSINSLYHSQLQVKNALAIGISQSGASPDLCNSLQAAKEAGATTVAIVNKTNSVLAGIADFVIPMHAGEEKAVAATKTYIASLSAIAQLVAYYADNKTLLKALPQLPMQLELANKCSWQAAVEQLHTIHNIFVLGRGIGFPIAEEAALKFKETANIHAESFSSAEFQHGPMALAKPNVPFLLMAQADATLPGVLAFSEKLTNLGTKTLLACAADKISNPKVANTILPLPNSLQPVLDPITTIQAFYLMMAELAVNRGYNPDKPENLNKVTETH
jgi:glucosamine--fructose-6-phosphate aminotransferase (isomerizing)